MPANSPGFIWALSLLIQVFDGLKERDIPIYICNDCGLDFRLKVSHKLPVPFCIFCNSLDIEQIGTEKI
jgi:hypothetical protein